MDSNNSSNLNLEMVQMRHENENEMVKNALAAMLEHSNFQNSSNTTLTQFKKYLKETKRLYDDKDLNGYKEKREKIGPYYPPGKLSSTDVKNICSVIGLPFYMVFCQDFGDHKNGIYMKNFFKFKPQDIIDMYSAVQTATEVHWLLKRVPASYKTDPKNYQQLKKKILTQKPKMIGGVLIRPIFKVHNLYNHALLNAHWLEKN